MLENYQNQIMEDNGLQKVCTEIAYTRMLLNHALCPAKKKTKIRHTFMIVEQLHVVTFVSFSLLYKIQYQILYFHFIIIYNILTLLNTLNQNH
jgi:hypothetical protein